MTSLGRKLCSTCFNNKLLFRNMSAVPPPRNLVAIIQLKCGRNKDINFSNVEKYVIAAAGESAKMAFLPENCDFVVHSKKDIIKLAEDNKAELIQRYCDLAKKCRIWLSIGGIHIIDELTSRLHKTHLVIDSSGKIVSRYVKSHVFYRPNEYNTLQRELQYISLGKEIGPPVETPCGLVGLGIGYDVKFPEMSILLRRAGAQILTYPFLNVSVLKNTWRTLLIARAIETQSYVIAASHGGGHGKHSCGNSVVISPLGKVVAEVQETHGIATADINIHSLKKLRSDVPIIAHRRHNLYTLCTVNREDYPWSVEVQPVPADFCQYTFGNIAIRTKCVVLKTYSCYASVNKKPVTKNHLLVIPNRPAPLLKDYRIGEVCDLGQTVFLVFTLLRFARLNTDIQIAIQDGPNSGQTIQHLHVHLVPVEPKSGIMSQGHEDGNRPSRELPDMELEAYALRSVGEDIIHSKLTHFLSEPPKRMEFSEPKDVTDVTIRNCSVHWGHVLFATKLFVVVPAPNPVLEGHTLLSYRGSSSNSFDDLKAIEAAELFQCLQVVEKALMKCFDTSSVTMFSKISHGNNISQFLFHILPRKKNDLQNNDDIYPSILRYEKDYSEGNLFMGNYNITWIKSFQSHLHG